jgi:predicted phosphodiesterase
MVKIQIVSDIHAEAYHDPVYVWNFINPTEPVAVVAGDIDARKFEVTVTEIASKFEKVICVLGNHEFYHRDISWRPDPEKMPDNVVILDRSAYEYEDVLFVGCSLWTDFGNADPFVMRSANDCINDFRLTRNSEKRFTTKDAIDIHYKDKAWLKLMVEQNRGRKIVIVTHFMPSYQCVNEKWKTTGSDTLNRYFSSNCDDLIGICEPGTKWIAGHTHDAFDQMLGDVRVVINPYGYPGENRGHYQDKVIEV